MFAHIGIQKSGNVEKLRMELRPATADVGVVDSDDVIFHKELCRNKQATADARMTSWLANCLSGDSPA